ncbi:uncharacterized protein LOC123314125 [Coccinella septempunctata]|uniref:uncharacterized protein LOC123314125 n=1 Tax=Coccinella septempunctata TaxID=41139 RepID=UPI001D07B373|nr:uncharacterized protein LOC123314125 [Coccinella septempunctata]
MASGSNGFRAIMEVYNNFMETKSDPRTSNWLLMSSPGPLITILVTYLYFCISAGPRYMRDRKPYDLKLVIQAYNALQIVLSIYLVYLGLAGGWAKDYSFACQPVDYSVNPTSMTMATAVWLYFITKIIELVDTVFFVLRKKMNQVSFLHLYHHTMMPICGWIGTKFLPGGHGTLLGVINSFIHIIMYTYYLMASMGPQYQKYLWWKKHVTALQMVQFCIIFVHNSQVLFRDCDYPKIITFLLATQALFFLYLFGSFYHRSYIQARKWEQARQKRQQARIAAQENEVKEGETSKGMEETQEIVMNGKAKCTMALLLKKLYQSYFWIFDDLADHRTDDWLLMGNGPWIPAAIMLGYLYFVFKIGPNFMKDRPPYNLKQVLIIYNVIQILANGYVLIRGIHMALDINWLCAAVDYSDGPHSRLSLELSFYYYLLKISDLLDTVFFILRKKERQLSFLHIYHHFGMIFLSWAGCKFLAGGHSMFVGLFNLIVHMVMYFYYLISAWDSRYKNSLWWKKHITQLQLAQFTILFMMYLTVVFQPNCGYPKFPAMVFLSQNIFMLILFGDFYYKAYIKKDTGGTEKKD